MVAKLNSLSGLQFSPALGNENVILSPRRDFGQAANFQQTHFQINVLTEFEGNERLVL